MLPAVICFVCVSEQNIYVLVYATVNSKTVISTQERDLMSVVGISQKTLVESSVAVRKDKFQELLGREWRTKQPHFSNVLLYLKFCVQI